MKWWICDKDGRALCDPLPDIPTVRVVLPYYGNAHFVIVESEAVPGKIIEMLMLRKAML